MRLRSTLATILPAVLVSFAVTWGVHSWRTPVEATSDDPFAILNLSAEQKLKIHEISMVHHPRLLAGQAAVDAKREELARLLAAPGSIDKTAVATALREVARLESDLDQEVATNLVELRPFLSEEQQKVLFQHIELRHPRNPRPTGGRP